MDQVGTGYLRLALDTLLNTGWLKQVGVCDIEDVDPPETSVRTDTAVQIGFPTFVPGISIIRTSWNVIAVGTQNGLVHVFDCDGALKCQARRELWMGDDTDAQGMAARAPIRHGLLVA